MLLAATTRSMMLVYVGVLGFFVLWAMAGVFTRDINNEWVAVLLDPFGLRAFGRMTRSSRQPSRIPACRPCPASC